MWKLVLLLSLLPVVATVLLRKWCCDRVLKRCRHGVTAQSGLRLAEHLLRHQGLASEIELRQKRKTRLVMGERLRIFLSLAAWNGKEVVTLGNVAGLVGRALIALDQPELVRWREWAVRFGWAFPAFTLLVVVFACAVAKLSVVIGLVIVMATLGVTSSLLLFTMIVELEAAKRAAFLVEETRAFSRVADSKEVAQCCRALAWRRVVPGAIEWVLRDPLKVPRNSLETKGE